MQNKYVFYTKKAQNLYFGLSFPLSGCRYSDISIFRLSFSGLFFFLGSPTGANEVHPVGRGEVPRTLITVVVILRPRFPKPMPQPQRIRLMTGNTKKGIR